MSLSRRFVLPLVLLVAMSSGFVSCTREKPLKIGFIAGMSGRVADLGVAGRNGVMLAIEQKNAAGGIKGRTIELVVRDDEQNSDRARAAFAALLEEKPEIVIGPMTSSMAMVMVPMANQAQTLLLSPTVTTNDLSGVDDYFMRVISGTRDYASKNARYQFEQLGQRRVAAIYDLGNQAYTESWFNDFRATFTALGGDIVGAVTYRSGSEVVFSDLVTQLLAADPDAVLILGNAVDAALICQQVRKQRPEVAVALSEWGATERFIQLSGATAEGVVVAQFLDRNDDSPGYQAFRSAFLARFGQEPGFAGLAGYDAALVAIAGLEQMAPGESLKQTLLRLKTFPCVQQPITLDRFGDADRKTFITVIRDGHFRTVE